MSVNRFKIAAKIIPRHQFFSRSAVYIAIFCQVIQTIFYVKQAVLHLFLTVAVSNEKFYFRFDSRANLKFCLMRFFK